MTALANPLPAWAARKSLAGWLALAVVLAVLPHVMPSGYCLRVYSLTGVYVMLALGLNVVAGFAGLLDLAYVAFFGIGAYFFAFLASGHFGIHLPFWMVLPVSAAVSMAVGFCLGATSIRLKGDYLAIVTLAFAQIFKILLLNLDQPVNITGGVNGIYNFDVIRVFGMRVVTPTAYAYLIWGMALCCIAGVHRLRASRYGRGWTAIREDELAARAVGVNATWMKLAAFAGGAFIAGGAGAVFASFQDSVFPNNFDFQQLVIVYCMVILGGLGNVPGVVLGAVLLSVLPEFLREYGAYRMMLYGLILVALMALRPKGLLGDIPWLSRPLARPDRDDSGVLKCSTDLYYRVETPALDATGAVCTPGDCEVLTVEDLSRDFGGIRALNRLDFSVYENEILSIIGPNGAGKTTLFNVISGIYPPTSGRIRFQGRNIAGLPSHKITRLGIARTFQNLRLFNDMTILDNVRVGRFCRTRCGPLASILHLPRHGREEAATAERAYEILCLFGGRLTGYRLDQKAADLSYANRRRLEMARAIATDAKILLLDEPAAGMNPQETEEVTRFIRSLRDVHGFTILLIEHKLNVVRAISDRVIALDYGHRIAEGTYDDVAHHPKVIESYLGRKRKTA